MWGSVAMTSNPQGIALPSSLSKKLYMVVSSAYGGITPSNERNKSMYHTRNELPTMSTMWCYSIKHNFSNTTPEEAKCGFEWCLIGV